ncbi:NAD(P)-binding protein [Calocera viscosa TUFC12733]|uniref:NAD(P)-binding protein n=1 Tax=Calocera viscosa (strain TUFC12733) TaxID=1330018 RepID=A0A167INW4_CALVF|nr:NAD(P)-binding protein [Calocera viscosa TUFC12733]
MPTGTEIALAVLLALFSGAYLLPKLYSAFAFLHIYTLHRSTLRSYVHSPRSFALVTGASDGIGRGLALELAGLGFNLILHGRNGEKLERVKKEILARPAGPDGAGKEVRVWVQDAAQPDIDWKAVGRMWEDVEVTVLVNNVGGAAIEREPFDSQSLAYVDRLVQLNALFPFHLTHTLLPQLRARLYPTLILTVGSMAGEIPPPHFAAYAASKAFLERFVHALDIDERLVLKSRVKLHYLQTATVLNSSGVIKRTAWSVPSSEAYGSAAVQAVGVRRRKVFPWMAHGLQAAVLPWLGDSITEQVMVKAVRDLAKEE